MKLTFELDLDDFYEYGDGDSFKDAVIYEVARKISLWIYNDEADIDRLRGSLKRNIDELVKENKDVIVDTVIRNVEKKILAKKIIKEEMPKASEIAALDKENEEYFLFLIDKAIAKRFK